MGLGWKTLTQKSGQQHYLAYLRPQGVAMADEAAAKPAPDAANDDA